jgi:hypothetical protein
MAQPAMAVQQHNNTSSSTVDDSSSSSSSYGIRIEGTLPAAVAAKAAAVWQGLGLQDLNAAAEAATAAAAAGTAEGGELGFCMEAGGTMWTPYETILMPLTFGPALYEMFAFLPHTLWEMGCKGVTRMLAAAAGKGKANVAQHRDVDKRHSSSSSIPASHFVGDGVQRSDMPAGSCCWEREGQFSLTQGCGHATQQQQQQQQHSFLALCRRWGATV